MAQPSTLFFIFYAICHNKKNNLIQNCTSKRIKACTNLHYDIKHIFLFYIIAQFLDYMSKQYIIFVYVKLTVEKTFNTDYNEKGN